MNADLLSEIVTLAKREKEVEAQKDKLEEQLKVINARLTRLREEDLPSAMAEAGVKEFKLEDGTKVTVKDEVYCSLSESMKGEAFAWLAKVKADGIIKCVVEVAFGRGDREKAAKLYAQLVKRKVDVTMGESIHPQTLKAFVGERLREKQEMPLELFGARPISRAVVKLPKGKE